MTMTNVHLSDGTLRALADHELKPLARLTSSVHLLRCRRCRVALDAIHADERRARELLSLLERPVDIDEGWRRVAASMLRREPAARRAPLLAGSAVVAWAVAAILAVVAGTLVIERMRVGPSVAINGSGHQDVCCWDLDGGGPSDDGVMTMSRPGELLDCVILYDDVDRSRSFSGGDAIRYVSRPESCGVLTELYPRSTPGVLLALSKGGR